MILAELDEFIEEIKDEACPFCARIDNNSRNIIKENDLAVAMLDEFPVSRYHVLVIPKNHRETYFDLTRKEKEAIDSLIDDVVYDIIKKDDVTGFNIGWNCGESAGQTIFHAHCHLIPRRDGDTDRPEGGVRHCIPEKGYYRD